MLEVLLAEHGGKLLSAITSGTELDQGQAENLLPPALSGMGEALRGGNLNLSELLGGDSSSVSALLGKLDIGQIAGQAGLDEGQARNGLTSLVPVVLSLLGDKAGGAEGLLSMLGGDTKSGAMGALGSITGKFFGR